MSKTIDYNRDYKKKLQERGVSVWPRTVPVPEGCWMCGRTNVKLAKARLFPDWMLKVFGCGDFMYTSAHLDGAGNVLDHYDTAFKKLGCEQVCQNCIHGWINELDTAFKSVFLGDINVALEEQPILFARWAAKTATLINISQQLRLQIPAEARHGLSGTTTLPTGWRVYAFNTTAESQSPIDWIQGAPMLAPMKANTEKKGTATLGNLFTCALKISNLGLLAYWHPDDIYNIEPVSPLKRLWPDPEGTLTDESWHLYTGMCVADVSNSQKRWLEMLQDTRQKVANGSSLYDS
jgi:uncharacterized protein YbdZ (MbtH family)